MAVISTELKTEKPSLPCSVFSIYATIYRYLLLLFFDDTTKAPHALDTLTELLKTLSVEQLELIAQIAREFSEK